ncbi:nephrocystin-3-like [Montipora capricornis]|uniref:nephrocystin-3-like n=1 Tax=Montipora capricornis TaxID=246305 RepID=UPI0035F15523
MTILEDDDESIQKAIRNSFDLFKQAEKDALVAVSIFPGSFDSNAAEAVLKETLDSETLPIKTLRSLKNKSLVVVEQEVSRRYQMHSPIGAFAKKIGETENPQVLLHSGELACAHFISRLEENSKCFQAESQPVHRVELLCLLGQEMRRLGDKTKYKDHMEEANRLFSAQEDGFGETKVLSHVFYLHSRARFLSEENSYDLEPKMLYDKALKICEKNLPDHPETAVNLLFAGRNAKRRKDAEATEKFQRAYSLFKKLLGDHFMTAQCLKDFADFVFLSEKSDQGLDKALEYYEKAMEVMEMLGAHEQKESILTLKNYGICHVKKGNFEEAEKLLLKAELVCERELENADHTRKVMVKTHLGLLYHEMAEKQENEASVREGLLNKMDASTKKGLDM